MVLWIIFLYFVEQRQMNVTLDTGIDWGTEIKTPHQDINSCRAKIIFEYGLTEGRLSKEEEIISIMIKKLLDRNFPIT